jgi:hypothetical protein
MPSTIAPQGLTHSSVLLEPEILPESDRSSVVRHIFDADAMQACAFEAPVENPADSFGALPVAAVRGADHDANVVRAVLAGVYVHVAVQRHVADQR